MFDLRAPRSLLLLLALALALVLIACPSDDDDDTTDDDDDATDDDDDAIDDDDATDDDDDDTDDDDDAVDDDDATDDDDDGTDDDDATDDDDDATPAPATCGGWADDDILDVVYSGPKVPAGYFSDSYPPGEFPQWAGSGCSPSLESTQIVAGAIFGTGTPTGATRSELQFYEVSIEINGGANTVHFREHRCDYWNGAVLAGAPFAGTAELQGLAGYLWYSGFHNFGGFHILDGFGAVGDATNFFELCHVSTVYGDFGLYDEVTLWSTAHSVLQNEGVVTIAPPSFIRTIQGNLN